MQLKSKYYSLCSFLNGVTIVYGVFCAVLGWWVFNNAWMSIAGVFMTVASISDQELMRIKNVKENTDWDQK